MYTLSTTPIVSEKEIIKKEIEHDRINDGWITKCIILKTRQIILVCFFVSSHFTVWESPYYELFTVALKHFSRS